MGIINKEKYMGVTIKQVKGIFPLFDSFFVLEKFDNIIEIGTGNGGFSAYIAMKAKEVNAKFITYDIKKITNLDIKGYLKFLDVDIRTCNVNNDVYIENIIKGKGRCLLLIDGALKSIPFKRFAGMIKENDIIMTHDYYKNESISEYGTFVFSEVEKSINDNNLKIIYPEFENYLWLTVKK